MVRVLCMPVILTYLSVLVLHVRCTLVDDYKFAGCSTADTNRLKIAVAQAHGLVSKSVERLRDIRPRLANVQNNPDALNSLLKQEKSEPHTLPEIPMMKSTAFAYSTFIDSNLQLATSGDDEVAAAALSLLDKTIRTIAKLKDLLEEFKGLYMLPRMQFQCRQWLTPAPANDIPPNPSPDELYFVDLRSRDAGRTPAWIDDGLVILSKTQGDMILNPPESPMFSITGVRSGPRLVIVFNSTSPAAHSWSSWRASLFSQDFKQNTVSMFSISHSSFAPLLLFLMSQSSLAANGLLGDDPLEVTDEFQDIYRSDASRMAEFQSDFNKQLHAWNTWNWAAESASTTQKIAATNLEALITALGFERWDWSRLFNYYKITDHEYYDFSRVSGDSSGAGYY